MRGSVGEGEEKGKNGGKKRGGVRRNAEQKEREEQASKAGFGFLFVFSHGLFCATLFANVGAVTCKAGRAGYVHAKARKMLVR
jgi:NADH:ubiquinone oxidoreductase subunit 5 (subunit L)/multisubunit Na+/H+ antiporter MnhA subunit